MASPTSSLSCNIFLPCDIFLSHSGAQKGFVRDLYCALCGLTSYSVFFDQDHHSLPRGQPFPPRIFSAAQSCRLAIVVLSEEFVTSPWPIMELCSFVDRLGQTYDVSSHPAVSVTSPMILPLFYKLSEAEMKIRENVEKWRRTWEKWEEEGRRICAQKCEKVVTKLLTSLNGVVRRPHSEQGEASYIDEIVSTVASILPPSDRFRFSRPFDDPDKPYVGIERLSGVLLDKFRKLEELPDASSSAAASPAGDGKVSILGMYGLSGSGKSTLCRFLCDSMFDEFDGRVVIVSLPRRFDATDPEIKVFTPWEHHCIRELRKMNDCLPGSKFDGKRRMFLVIDNICTATYRNVVPAILRLISPILGSGSRVMFVSRSVATMEALRNPIFKSLAQDLSSRSRYDITDVPRLTEAEAIAIIMHPQHAQHSQPADNTWSREEFMNLLFRKSKFASSNLCRPSVLHMIRILLRNASKYKSVLQKLVKVAKKEKQNVLDKLFDSLVDTIIQKLEEELLEVAESMIRID